MLQANLTNRTIGDFKLKERIGTGGMASVYRAVQGSVNRDVAFKAISLDPNYDFGNQQEFEQRFAQEASVVASLEHIHIVPIYSYGVLDRDVAYLVMRLLLGGTLDDQLKQGPLPLEMAVNIFTQTAIGLHYAHTKGIIHRDLKPSNILFDEVGNAYLSDFGLAKVVSKSLNLTHSGMLVGTPTYISPEQLQDNAAIDHRTDIYGMGILLYHMLTGRPPFELGEGGLMALLKKHREAIPVLPSVLNPHIPVNVEQVVMRALEKAPDARFSSVEEMNYALNEAVRNSWTSLSISYLQRRHHPKTTHRRQVMTAFSMFAVIMLMTVFFYQQQHYHVLVDATILTDVYGSLDEMQVTPEEIQRARRFVGDGFIGFIACDLSTETSATRARLVNDLFMSYDIPLHIYDVNNNYEQIPNLIGQAVSNGARGFFVCPYQSESIDETLQYLQAKKFPLVLLSVLDSSYGGVMVDWHHARLAEEAANYASRIINQEYGGEGKVVILDSPPMPGTRERATMIERELRQNSPNIEVVGRYITSNEREPSKHYIAELLELAIPFNMIIAVNDANALGAIDALAAHNVAYNDVAIIGINGESIAREYIHQGRYYRATVPNNVDGNAQACVNAMIKLLSGGEIAEYTLVPPLPIITRQTLHLSAEVH